MGCENRGCRLDGCVTLSHSNPELSGSGGGVWERRAQLSIVETGGRARTNESVSVDVELPEETVRNPYKELRLTDESGLELPSFVQSASFKSHFCTGASLIFAAPTLEASGAAKFYVYYGNPSAQAPTYDSQLYIGSASAAPPFRGAGHPPRRAGRGSGWRGGSGSAEPRTGNSGAGP